MSKFDIFIKSIEELCTEKNKLVSDIYLSNMSVFRLVPLEIYIARFIKFAKIEDTHIKYINFYFRKLNEKKYYFMKQHLHKLLAILIIIFIKFYYDNNYSMKYYSNVAGISYNDILKMEIDILSMLDYELYISDENILQTNILFITI